MYAQRSTKNGIGGCSNVVSKAKYDTLGILTCVISYIENGCGGRREISVNCSAVQRSSWINADSNGLG